MDSLVLIIYSSQILLLNSLSVKSRNFHAYFYCYTFHCLFISDFVVRRSPVGKLGTMVPPMVTQRMERPTAMHSEPALDRRPSPMGLFARSPASSTLAATASRLSASSRLGGAGGEATTTDGGQDESDPARREAGGGAAAASQ